MARVMNLLPVDKLRTTLPIGLTILALAYMLRPGRTVPAPLVVQSPLKTVLSLPEAQQSLLPYPPDALPGARTLSSPWGRLRIYEFGPADGPRVLLLHGISTPCISLASVSRLLAAQGYRVMLFDLLGRGYSDTPDPAHCDQDIRLFCAQILLAVTSAEVEWVGAGRKFRIVGYSMGGGVAMGFTSHFPELVEDLVIIAPSGLLRESRIAWSSRLVYSGWVPDWLVQWVVRRRMGGGTYPAGGAASGNPEATIKEALDGEVPDQDSDHPALMPDSRAELSEDNPGVSVADAVKWQLDHHDGFLPAFVSSIQHAPIAGQHDSWRVVRDHRSSLKQGKVLMILGTDDGVIVKEEIEEDARSTLGENGLDVRFVEAGHDLPIVKPKEVATHIVDFWAGNMER